jgi:hypothetical protein
MDVFYPDFPKELSLGSATFIVLPPANGSNATGVGLVKNHILMLSLNPNTDKSVVT